MVKGLKQIWVSKEAHRCLKAKAANEGKKMIDAFDDLVKDSKNQKERWGKLF